MRRRTHMSENVAQWVCEVCRAPVDDRKGMLYCNSGAANGTYRSRERWRVAHFDCLREGQEGIAPYIIDVERIRTPEHVVAWTAHLMTKTWLPGTDWHRKLQELAKAWGSADV